MFTEILKLKPVMDTGQLNRMFNDLSSRFGRIAKTFGAGMKTAMKFTGIIGLVSAVVAKILNPLERAEELFNKFTKKGDDAVTNAKEFGTTPGKLLRFEHLAQAKGVDSDTFRTLLTKFQGKLAAERDVLDAPARIRQDLAAETDPIQQKILQAQLHQAEEAAAQGGLLRAFVDEKDTAEAFFKFLQTVGKLDPARRVVVQNEVLGERIRGKASELVNSAPEELAAILAKLPRSDDLEAAAVKLGAVSDLHEEVTSVREAFDFITKSGLINKGQALSLNRSMAISDESDNNKLRQFDASKSTSIAIQELMDKFDKFSTELINDVLPNLVKGINELIKLIPSPDQAKNAAKDAATMAAETGQGFVDFLNSPISSAPPGLSPRVEEMMSDLPMGSMPQAPLEEVIRRIHEDIKSMWAEFKASRLYRMFGN